MIAQLWTCIVQTNKSGVIVAKASKKHTSIHQAFHLSVRQQQADINNGARLSVQGLSKAILTPQHQFSLCLLQSPAVH